MFRLSSILLALAALLLSPACATQVQGDDDPVPQPDAGVDIEPPPPGPDAGACASVRVELSETTPNVMFLVDRSGTMERDFGDTDRWSAVYDTLMNPTRGVVASLQDKVRFGLALYTSDDGFAGGACPILDEAAPALQNYSALSSLYSGKGPIEDTPTGAAIHAMVSSLQNLNEDGPKIIVLATDGEPDSCTVPDPDGHQAAKNESIAAAQVAYQSGIETFIISVGDEVGEAHLADMANAGVGLPVGGLEQAPYYRALNPDQLVAAFDDIIGGVRACTFALEGEIDPEQADSGTVTLDGMELDHGTEWHLKDSRTLELLGAACDEVLAGGDHEVEAEFSCGAVVL